MPKTKIRRTRTRSIRVPYSKASDDEKVARNWRKAVGLFEREEYSVAILRCSTCIELAVNFAVRQELVTTLELPLQFVDRLLLNTNGIHNKFQNIYLPIMAQYQEHDTLKNLWKQKITKINSERNKIAHSGEFRGRKAAHVVMTNTYDSLLAIMGLYELGEELARYPVGE